MPRKLFPFLLLLAVGFSAFRLQSKSKSSSDEWPAYGRDGGGSRYSPLAEINRQNVSQLKVAWTYRTGADEIRERLSEKACFEATPILVDGRLYLTTPYSRVIALDPATGKEKWNYDPQVDLKKNYSEVTSRGVSTWPSPANASRKTKRRIFVATLDARLIALDAATGALCEDFGEKGQVDLKTDVRFQSGPNSQNYQVTSPPAVIGDLVIVGSSIGDNGRIEMERGIVRAYDARSGKRVWGWDPIPTNPDDPARLTWTDEGATKTGAANAWSILSVDEARGLVFVPTGSPSPDFYGGERKGDNEYANSVVALRAKTGEVVWHFQVVHHDLWDYDVAAQPMLIDIKRSGKTIPAVAVGTKMGMLFILHRETGRPVFNVEEKPVAKGDIPEEYYSPTQPFPDLPRPLVPHRLTPDDAWGLTEKDREYCREKLNTHRAGEIYTPPSVQGSVFFPGNVGGINWGGMAYDPARNLLFAGTNRLATVVRLIPREEYGKTMMAGRENRLKGEFTAMAGAPYGMYREALVSPSGAPCNAPPWGTLAAVDLGTGELKWETPLGAIPQLGLFQKSKEWGSLNLGGPIVTAGGLIFVAASMDTALRAFDVETGKEVWKADLPASAQATPMTYRYHGKQYVVISAGGHGKLGTKRGDSVVAFALP